MQNLTPHDPTDRARFGLFARALRALERHRRRAGPQVGIAAALLVVAPVVWAQQPPSSAPAHDAPAPADLEPGVNTSAPPPPDTSPPAPAPVPAGAASAAKQGAAAGKPSASSKEAASSKADMASKTDSAAGAAQGANKAGKKAGGKAEDHLQLDTTQITGNQELPKVLYIVPWKRSDLGDLLGKPANSLLDDVLQPVDRDVFRRENRYYDALKPDGGAAAGKAAGQASGDKH